VANGSVHPMYDVNAFTVTVESAFHAPAYVEVRRCKLNQFRPALHEREIRVQVYEEAPGFRPGPREREPLFESAWN